MRLGRVLAVTAAATALMIAAGSSTADQPAPSSAAQTAAGTVTSMSPDPALAIETSSDGSRSYCFVWQGTLRTVTGQTIGVHLESPAVGVFPKVHATDPTAAQIAHTLFVGWFFRKVAMATVTYTPGPALDCGYSLPNVVTNAVLTFAPPKPHRATGPIVVLTSRKTLRGDGAVCAVWYGTVAPLRSDAVDFAVESAVSGGHAGAQALRLVQALGRTKRQGTTAVATVTYGGPVLACGHVLLEVVTAVSERRAPTRR